MLVKTLRSLAAVLAVLTLTVGSLVATATNPFAQGYDDYDYGYDDYDYGYDYDYDYGYSTRSENPGVVFGVLCGSLLCILIIEGVLAFIVYNDAKKSGSDNVALWTILTFLFGLIPLIIYFAAGKKKTDVAPTPVAETK